MHNNTLRSFLRCVSFCTASSYDLLGLATFFKKKGYFTRLSRDVLHVTNLKRPGDIFFFNHGCFVCWGFKKSFEDKLLEYVKEFAVHPSPAIETDHLYYRYGEETTLDTHERLRLDIITLDSEDAQTKLAISYGLAQSIKLEAFEEAIKEAIKKIVICPKKLQLVVLFHYLGALFSSAWVKSLLREVPLI